MDLVDIILEPKTPFHLGMKEHSVQETATHIYSDTFFSAFCNVYRLIYGKNQLEHLLKQFQSNPPFLCSSIFPSIDGQRLYPAPKHINFQTWTDKREKRLKHIMYVSEHVFKLILEGKTMGINDDDIAQDGQVLTPGYNGLVWYLTETPRVTIDRLHQGSTPYYFGEIIYPDQLHFLLNIIDKSFTAEIKTTLRVMGDEGLGGDRSAGKGLFSVQDINTISFPTPSTEWFITLSLVNPLKQNIGDLNGFFSIVDRGGWGYSVDDKNTRKNMIRMFTEGSVFNQQLTGRLVEVANSTHPFYRYGYSLMLPVKVKT